MVNSIRGKEIVCKRGVEAGDPLSPLNFVLIADGLNHMIAKCRKEGMLKWLGCRDEANEVTNLQYADDTLLFDIVSLPQALVQKGVLRCYELWSGIKIKFQKSFLVLLQLSASSFRLCLNALSKGCLLPTWDCHFLKVVLTNNSGGR